MNSTTFRSPGTLLTLAAAMLLGATTMAHGAFHFWNIREVYTDASGTRQFIEFFTPFSSQNSVGGQQITVTDTTGTNSHTFTIPSSFDPFTDTSSRAFLIATVAATNSGAPIADYVISNNFLFADGGSISFFGANSGPYSALPTDGVLSRSWDGGDAVNSPQNFAGQIGTVTVPNSPPTILITNPPANRLFAAPATVAVGVSASDSDGTVASVRLLTNGVAAVTNTVPPFGFTLANLAAGNYTLLAIAQDNGSLNTTSAPVTIRVAARPVLTAAPGIGGLVQFQFTSRTGVNYVVERADPLTNFSSVTTNPGSGGTLQFQESDGSLTQRSYRVRLE